MSSVVVHRSLSRVLAGLALVSGTAGCAATQSTRVTVGRVVHGEACTPELGIDGVPRWFPPSDGTVEFNEGTHNQRCRCMPADGQRATDAGAHRWQCAAVVFGPLSPPELPA